MKSKLVFAALAGLLGILLVATPAVQAACSTASVAGRYGYTTTGTIIVSGTALPVAAVGVITFDLQGNVSGSQTRNVAGTATDETYSGTYTVNSDCTGNFTVTVQPSGRVSTVNIVWVDNTKGAHAIFTNAGTVLTATANRM